MTGIFTKLLISKHCEIKLKWIAKGRQLCSPQISHYHVTCKNWFHCTGGPKDLPRGTECRHLHSYICALTFHFLTHCSLARKVRVECLRFQSFLCIIKWKLSYSESKVEVTMTCWTKQCTFPPRIHFSFSICGSAVCEDDFQGQLSQNPFFPSWFPLIRNKNFSLWFQRT